MNNRRRIKIGEIVVVLFVLALFIAILLPSLSRAREYSGPNGAMRLKGIGTCVAIYAAQYQGSMPVLPGAQKLQWLCDEPLGMQDLFGSMQFGRLPPENANFRKMFYDPHNEAQNPATLSRWQGIEVWGFVMLNDRGPRATRLPQDFPTRDPPLDYISALDNPSAAPDKELALEEIISDRASGSVIHYQNIQRFGVPTLSITSSHMFNSKIPSGANVLAVDGHVTWRPFTPAHATAIRQGGTSDVYFWIPYP